MTSARRGFYREEAGDWYGGDEVIPFTPSPVRNALDLLCVGLGGALGSVLRYVASGWVQRFDLWGSFPAGTLAVNVAGCATIGILAGLSEARSVFGPTARLFVFIGVLGFTTFSTFSYETLALIRGREAVKALLNVTLSLVFCLLGTWLGFGLGNR